MAYALGQANNPASYWVSICDEGTTPQMDDPVRLGWIPDDHRFVVSAPDARPQDAVANMALWTVVRSDEPKSVLAEITDFIRLPAVIQQAVSESGIDSQRPVLVIANTDRVREFYPREAEGVRHVLDPLRRSQLQTIFASVGSPGAGRMAFDVVFEVRTSRTGGTLCSS